MINVFSFLQLLSCIIKFQSTKANVIQSKNYCLQTEVYVMSLKEKYCALFFSELLLQGFVK